ncbi:hypothetical protein Pyn_13426 [Prunus yedoensis var. nudiflora]|uniref:Uncharacterized protein n=1 Tax=Prunus yedoensis var. nudiflora TaxID=2094558 RepID=A0A314ZNZ7_PRUYE|nr:hypothetical protein Pyn_13426 [Prunus yedoensis var. nudiflora]
MNFKVNLPNADTKELLELRVSPGFSVSIASWQVHKDAKMIKIIVCFIIKPEVLNDHKANSTLPSLDDHDNSSFFLCILPL